MIRLTKAALYPYRCIEELQNLDLTENVITLVGRNEAGKTSVLNLLAKSNYYDTVNDLFFLDEQSDYPRRKRREFERLGKPPLATILTYEVTGEVLAQIRKEMLLPEQSNCFSRSTDYTGAHRVAENGFNYDPYAFWAAYAAQKAPVLQEFYKSLAGLHTKADFERFYTRVSAELGKPEKIALSEVSKYFENPHNWDNPINEYVYRTYLLPGIPRFLYYDECSLLPSEIYLEKLQKEPQTTTKRIIQAFLALIGMDTEEVLEAKDLSPFQSDLENAQAELSEAFLHVWNGNPNIRVELSLERRVVTPEKKRGFFRKSVPPIYETVLNIRIRDVHSMVTLPLESRSKGFHWFFSFWVWFRAIQETEQTPFILLLDEPGLHLHEDAQKDLLMFMQKLSQSYQLLYTTHSPFMLEDDIQGVYSLVNGESGTIITPLKNAESLSIQGKMT